MDGRAFVMIAIWVAVGTLYVLVMRNYNKRKKEDESC
jgi:hypothetical protein